MDELFKIAEEEMLDLYHPYVGTEHFFLAFLKVYKNAYVSYETFRDEVIKIIGRSNKRSEYILYTPILRDLRNTCSNYIEAVLAILTNEDSIAYNILLSMGIDIEALYLSIINTNS